MYSAVRRLYWRVESPRWQQANCPGFGFPTTREWLGARILIRSKGTAGLGVSPPEAPLQGPPRTFGQPEGWPGMCPFGRGRFRRTSPEASEEAPELPGSAEARYGNRSDVNAAHAPETRTGPRAGRSTSGENRRERAGAPCHLLW